MAEFRDRMATLVANSLIDDMIGSRDDTEGSPQNAAFITMADLDKNYDQNELDALLQERINSQESDGHNGSSGVTNTATSEIVIKAKLKALELLPQRLAEHEAAIQADATKPTGATLFLSQLNATGGGGGLLDGFVTWGMIQEQATSDEEKIDRLAKIPYVDDILEDWENDIRPYLTQWETLPICNLYRTLFTKARSTGTTDSYAMQRDLTMQLLDVSLSVSSAPDVSPVALEFAVRMFIDLVDRSIPGCHDIGRRLWQIILANPKNLLEVVVRTDPYATSFALWLSTDEMTVNDTLTLISGTSLAGLDDAPVDIATLLNRAVVAGRSAPNDHFYFTLSLLCSIMNCTRVYTFPWEHIADRNWADVLGLFLQGAAGTDDECRIAICFDALDILDSGMVQPELRKKLLSECHDEKKRLQQYCDEMEASDRKATISSLLDRFFIDK